MTCDAMCGGPSSKCGHCGGNSCPGSVSKANQALEFVKEANEKVLAKQREAEELLSRVRESKPEISVTKLESENALRIVKAEVARVNQTKQALEKQIETLKAFLEMERASPDEIKARVDQILNVSIPFSEEQIQSLSQNVSNFYRNF